MKNKDISYNLTDNKYRWWLGGSNYAFPAVVIVAIAALVILPTFQASITYLLNNHSIYTHVGYWTCYWFAGTIDMIVLSGWFLLKALRLKERSMKIAARVYRDFCCPLVGIGLTVIGVAYAIVGIFVILVHQILGASFFLVVSIVLIVLTMTLQSMGQERWAVMSLYALIPAIALYGVTSIIESMLDCNNRKMKRN
jgi:hypothetical protein